MEKSPKSYEGKTFDLDNEDVNLEVSDARKIRFQNLGRKFTGFFVKTEAEKKEIEKKKTIERIRKLDKSRNKRDQDTLRSMQSGYGADISDGDVLDALLNTRTGFRNRYLDGLLFNGADEQKIAGNRKIREEVLSDFLKALQGEDIPVPAGAMLIGEQTYREEFGMTTKAAVLKSKIISELLEDGDLRKKIIEQVGKEKISKYGDELMDELFHCSTDPRRDQPESDFNIVLERVEQLKSLGYDYFEGEKGAERIKSGNLIGRYNWKTCETLKKAGFMRPEIVDELYKTQYEKLMSFVNDGEKNIPGNAELANYFSIPAWLEPSKENKAAQYWKSQTEKLEEYGIDPVLLVVRKMKGVTISHHGYTTDLNVDSWFENGILTDEFFNQTEVGAPAHDLKYAFHRPLYKKKNYDSDLMTFFASNLDRIKDGNMRGFVKNWNEINGGTDEKTEKLRLSYMIYMAQGSDRFRAYPPEWKEVSLFDDEGRPNDHFYKGVLSELMDGNIWRNPIDFGFVPYIDNWEEYLDNMTLRVISGNSKNGILIEGGKINKENIVQVLTRFIDMDAIDWTDASEEDIKIKEAFGGSEIKDLALAELRKIYTEYLTNGQADKFPVGLKTLADYMHNRGGAGPLTQIEAFLDFVSGLDGAGDDGRNFTMIIEEKMAKEHWDNQDKTNFYAVSAEILQASPEIYNEFANLFANLSDRKEFKVFVTEIYPLYRAKLALLREYEDHSNGIGFGYSTANYESVNIEDLKNQLHKALLPFNLHEISPDKRREGIEKVKEIILGEISELFQKRFKILPSAIPEDFSKQDMRLVEDMTLYLSNLAAPDEIKKDIIGYFLATQFSGGSAWDRLRGGIGVPPSGFMESGAAANVERALEESRANNPVSVENTGIKDGERLKEFRVALQAETRRMHVGNIMTVDRKLQSLIGGIQELMDPDLYTIKVDKDRVALLGRYSTKIIGKVASTMYQRLAGKDVSYGDGEEEIADELARILEDDGIEVTAENVKTYFQTGLNGIKEPFAIAEKIEKSGALEKMAELDKILMPPEEVRQIFGKLGEEFRPQSGVLAFGADLDFLENLVIKRENELDQGDVEEVKEYIGLVREKLIEINEIYEKTVQSFERMKNSQNRSMSDAARNRVSELEKTLYGNGQAVITTICTNEMTTIIENMRACLSGKTKGINNDTNLTFGEGYKFYLYSKDNSTRSDSSTDEIVYFVPVGEGENKRMGFVMDKIYGLSNEDIMISHIETVLKKARELKQQFPEVPISVILPPTSMTSCGVKITADSLTERLESKDDIGAVDIEVEKVLIPKSGFGDHYVEFGGAGARTAGERSVSGIEIILK